MNHESSRQRINLKRINLNDKIKAKFSKPDVKTKLQSAAQIQRATPEAT